MTIMSRYGMSRYGMGSSGMSRFSRAIRLAVVLAAPVVMAIHVVAPASAQTLSSQQSQSPDELRALNDQVGQVQRELNVLQRHVYQGRDIELAQAPSNLADFQIRVEELESRMRDMNGRIEELNYRINILNDRFDKFSTDLEFRLNSAQPGGGNAPSNAAPSSMGAANPPPLAPSAPVLTPPPGAGDPNRAPSQSGILGTLPVNPGQSGPGQSGPGQSGSPPAAPPPAAASDQPLPDGSPKERYDYAFALLTKSDYAGAERALQAFVAAYPTHQLAGNAQYWLGESYYVRSDFNNAARAFAMGLQKYPKSDKGPDNLLKLGLSLSALNKNKEACHSYDLLKKDFPKAPQEIARRAEAEKKRLRCN